MVIIFTYILLDVINRKPHCWYFSLLQFATGRVDYDIPTFDHDFTEYVS